MPSKMPSKMTLCVLSCVLLGVYVAVRFYDVMTQFQSISMTVYGGSGILVKGFPGDTTRVVQIAADNSVKPQLQQCDLSNQNEFFLSKAEINDSSDALKFDELSSSDFRMLAKFNPVFALSRKQMLPLERLSACGCVDRQLGTKSFLCLVVPPILKTIQL
eukprot:388929_1